MGELYFKNLSLEPTNNYYSLSYYCKGELCKCKSYKVYLNSSFVNKFVNFISNLTDEGESAKCCDHAWTEIKKGNKVIIVSYPIKIENFFDLCTD